MFWENKLIIRPKNIKIKKNNQTLFFFPDIPYWFVTTSDGERLLDALDGEHTLRELVGEPSDIVKDFLEPLIESEAIMSVEDLKSLKPEKFDISSVKLGQVNINVTNKCNLHCRHCCVANLNQKCYEMTTMEIKNIIDQLDELMDSKRRIIDFIGGEPTLRHDLIELLEYAQTRGFLVLMASNGTMIDRELASKLSSINMKLQISLDGATKDEHEYIRGEGSWNKTMDGLRLLIEYGIKPSINMVFHKKNINQIPDFIDLARSMNIDARFIPLVKVGRAIDSSLQYAGLEEMVDIIHQKLDRDRDCIDSIRSSYFMQLLSSILYSQRCRYCGTGLYTMAIDANGDVYPCLNMMIPEFKIGNALQTSLRELYSQSPILRNLRDIDVDYLNESCSKCDFKYLCGGGCRGETFQVTGKLYAPDIHCFSWRKAIEKLFWILIEYPELAKLSFDERLPQLI